MHCCCPLVFCSAVFVLLGGGLFVAILCFLSANADAVGDGDTLCSEGLFWLKWNMMVSIFCTIAVLNRQRKVIKEEGREPLIVEEATGCCGLLESVLAIAWIVWMIVGMLRRSALDDDCADGVGDWMTVAITGGFTLPMILVCVLLCCATGAAV